MTVGFAVTVHWGAFYAFTRNRNGAAARITRSSSPARASSAQVRHKMIQSSFSWPQQRPFILSSRMWARFLGVHRVQDTLVRSRWPIGTRRLRGPRWPPEHLPGRNLPSADGHRGPDCVRRACLHHLPNFLKVRLTSSVKVKHFAENSLITVLSSLMQLRRHPRVCLCKRRSGERELWGLQGQIYMSKRVLWRYVFTLQILINHLFWIHVK